MNSTITSKEKSSQFTDINFAVFASTKRGCLSNTDCSRSPGILSKHLCLECKASRAEPPSDTRCLLTALFLLWTVTDRTNKPHSRASCTCRRRIGSLFLPYPWPICLFSLFMNEWTSGELLIDLSAHYNADLGQDEIKGCRQLPHESPRELRLQPRLCHIFRIKGWKSASHSPTF